LSHFGHFCWPTNFDGNINNENIEHAVDISFHFPNYKGSCKKEITEFVLKIYIMQAQSGSYQAILCHFEPFCWPTNFDGNANNENPEHAVSNFFHLSQYMRLCETAMTEFLL
jgi:hypothetical protein